MINPDQKNLVLSNYNVNEINLLPDDADKIKHLVNYLEDVNALLKRYDETIKSLIDSNETVVGRLDSHSDHLSSHDQHLTAHDEHLQTLTKR